MKVLQICNDFPYSQVHANLYRELDLLGIRQTVYAYYGEKGLYMVNSFEGIGTTFLYKDILKKSHRFLFYKKIKLAYKDLTSSVNIDEFQLSHSISLFTNGFLSYRLYKDYGLPYIVAIRNTDLNVFMRYEPHTWCEATKVLLNAKRIIFISKAIQDRFCSHFLIRRILPKLQEKCVLLPNGIDDYWIDNVHTDAPNNHQLIYVGRFDTNKNVVRLVRAVLSLTDKYPDICLHLVGGGDVWEGVVLNLVRRHSKHIVYHGRIFDKEKLRELYRQCSVFAMPSFHETFGLVYLEALSQGLSVIFTRHEGIDGLFCSQVGEAVNAFSSKSIANAIARIFDNKSYYALNNEIDFNVYRWSNIAVKYKELYYLK